MKYNPDLHNRHSIRLHGYDYARTGAYFVTMCLNKRIFQCNANNSPNNSQAKGRHAGLPLRLRLASYFDFPILGMIENNVMILNDFGKMVDKYILMIANNADKFSNIKIGEYVIMPDHIHAIIEIDRTRRGRPACLPFAATCPPNPQPCPPNSQQNPPNPQPSPISIELGTVIQWFKTMTTNEYTNNVKILGWQPFDKKLWQRNYYEHIIRNETELAKITSYIRNNPILWKKKHVTTIL